jgi:hypothetical protein
LYARLRCNRGHLARLASWNIHLGTRPIGGSFDLLSVPVEAAAYYMHGADGGIAQKAAHEVLKRRVVYRFQSWNDRKRAPECKLVSRENSWKAARWLN